MKIVTIWSTYGPYHLARVRELQATFTKAEIHCLSHCAEEDEYPFFNLLPVNHKCLINKNAREIGFLESFFAAYRELRHIKPDLVLTCGYERSETLAAVVAARTYGGAVVLMLDNQLDDHPRNPVVEFVKRIYLKLFDGFIYGGDTHKDYLRHLGVNGVIEKHGYNCVDNDEIAELSRTFRENAISLLPFSGYFICVARLVPKKNIPILIAAFSTYKKAHGLAARKLVLCGDGKERENIAQAILLSGLSEDVIMLGRVDEFSKIVHLYSFACCAILPSKGNEQWGLVVNEAMAAALPVIVSRRCGCATSLVKDGENGFTIDPSNIEDIANKLALIHAKSDLQLKEMGRRSREIVDGFSPRQFAENIASLYRHMGGRE